MTSVLRPAGGGRHAISGWLASPSEASGCLVGPAVFKTVEGVTSPLAGSIPVRLRCVAPLPGGPLATAAASAALFPQPQMCMTTPRGVRITVNCPHGRGFDSRPPPRSERADPDQGGLSGHKRGLQLRRCRPRCPVDAGLHVALSFSLAISWCVRPGLSQAAPPSANRPVRPGCETPDTPDRQGRRDWRTGRSRRSGSWAIL